MVEIKFRSIRFFLWYAKAFFTRHIRALISFFLIGFLSTILMLFFQQQTSPLKNRITIGITGVYSIDNLPQNVQNLLSIGLTSLKENGEVEEHAAEEVLNDETGKVYKIKIKSNLVWHDGKTFTPDDINYNFKEVEKKIIDQNNLQFQLKEIFSPFPSLLAQPLFKKGLIGLGPYKLGRVNFESEAVREIELLPTTNQIPIVWPKDFTPETVKRINSETKIVIKFYPTTEMVKKALKLGEISVAMGLKSNSSFPETWYTSTGVIDYTHNVAVFLNTKDPLLREKLVRQALAFAIPQEIFSNEIRAQGPLPPTSWAYNEKLKSYETNLNTAKELIEKAKISSDEAKPRLVLSTFPQFHKLAQKIAESWQTLGFSVDISTQATIPQNFQAIIFSQEIPIDPDQYTIWHSTQTGNITGYISARNDKLLEDGRKTIDFEKRKQKYLDFQKYLVEDVSAIFLYYPTIYTISRK